MSDKIIIDLGSVQKTLFLPLWGRAYETKKENPLLVDKTALEIIEKVDFDFSSVTKNISELSQSAWITRSICVDKVIKEFLQKYPKATIVNIGCGLDTTFDRIDNGQLHWYDLDLPDVIELRKKFIAESDRRKFIAASFLQEEWMDSIITGDNVLFIAAGVLYYFEEEEIKSFFKKLADKLPGCEIFFDASSPLGVKTANQMVIKNVGLDESSFLKWGLKSATDILAWDERFKLLNVYYFFKDRKISLKLKIVGFVSDQLKMQYMVHLRLGAAN
jgi:O-methyltransferase involved in polyketide biosynthesis